MEGEAVKAGRVRALNRLSAIKVAKHNKPGFLEDGGGLRLVVTDNGTKRWALRLTINGRRVERGLGVWPAVGLDDARKRAGDLRRAAREGRDAQAESKLGRRSAGVTFRTAFEDFFAVRRQQLSNGKHVQQWVSTMETYVFPTIGRRPVSEVTAGEVLAVLEPIWFSRPETASRVLQRMKVVFDSAILRGTRERANPCIGVAAELGSDHRKVRHHAAIRWQDVPKFVADLQASAASPATVLALEFLIHTAARSGEVRGAKWSEFDLERRLWTIPAFDPVTGVRRMKAGGTHVVPLTEASIRLLAAARRLGDGPVVFPGSRGQPLSDSTLSKLMREMGAGGTPHGFRSTFKDWCAETGVRDEVSEAALAHADQNKVRAAYRRTLFLDERIGVMAAWSRLATVGEG